MNTLPENLINKIMLYVSHPCADMIQSALEQRSSSFLLHDNNSLEDDEYSYEFNVVQKHIYNRLQVSFISEDGILRLCPEYVHFNKSIINGILIQDEERLEIARIENDEDYDRADSESDFSETENMRHLFITH